MSLLLCHECFTWVRPVDGRCPQCLQPVEQAMPDPPLHVLQAEIGEVLHRIGEVKVRRRKLPDQGMLYATTNGLYFIPHLSERVTELIETHSAGSSMLWSLAALVWAPLMLVLPFVKSKQLKARDVQVVRPQYLSPDDSHQLPQFLMDNPGVFFVSLKSIRLVERKRNRWSIVRAQGTPVNFKPVFSPQVFHRQMAELIESDSWQHVMVNA